MCEIGSESLWSMSKREGSGVCGSKGPTQLLQKEASTHASNRDNSMCLYLALLPPGSAMPSELI